MAKKRSTKTTKRVKAVTSAIRELHRLEAVILDVSSTAQERTNARSEWARLNITTVFGKPSPALERFALKKLDARIARLLTEQAEKT